jgi:DNA repair protein RecO (recombination protein O)
MSYIKTKGIIIKEVKTGEADKIITVFTNGQGKISGCVKNARKSKNRLSAGTQLLCYCDFIMFKGKDIYTITSCEVIESFYEIRNDMIRLTYAAHILEIINDIVQEEQPATRVLKLFLNTMHMLSNTDKLPELITGIFELRLLSILGYAPYVAGCLNCGNEEQDGVSFSFSKCGFICPSCSNFDKYSTRISLGTARAMNYIVHSSINELFKFNLSKDVLDELNRVVSRYLRDRLEKKYTKLDFLKIL